ncbi:hypothetical protein GCM10022262_27470 [Georgenia daeguensis]|uniref:Uncharacterized protein n=1 Tax=Georgenia daeguensis TaxID=908355 RepID=A0ABP8EXD5_9MICO
MRAPPPVTSGEAPCCLTAVKADRSHAAPAAETDPAAAGLARLSAPRAVRTARARNATIGEDGRTLILRRRNGEIYIAAPLGSVELRPEIRAPKSEG